MMDSARPDSNSVVQTSLRLFLALSALAVLVPDLSATATAQPSTPLAPAWQAEPPVFHPDAALTGSPSILYFTATWCGFCKQMERTTLTDETVRTALSPLRPVKLDFDAQAELAAHYQVTGVPAFVAVNQRGEEVARAVGVMGPQALLTWLEGSKKRAAEQIALEEKAKAERAWLTEQLARGDPETKVAVQEKLFDLLGRGEGDARDFARRALTAQSQTDRSVLLVGLERPDLAVRIAAANLLRAQLKHDVAFDPWASPEERRNAVARLREALASAP